MSNFIEKDVDVALDFVKDEFAKLEGAVAPVEATVVTDVKSAVSSAEAIIERNGGQLLLSIAMAALDGLATGNWSSVASTVIAEVKAQGVATVEAEEQLAGSTALQVAQVVKTLQVSPAAS